MLGRASRSVCSTLAMLAAVASLVLAPGSASRGVVVIRDGFGDGDLNNDGTALEEGVDIIGAYTALGNNGSPLVFPMDTTIGAVTTIDNAADTGIRWFSTGGFTSNGTGDPAATPRIVNDSAGVMPETVGNVGFLNQIPSPSATQHIPALDSGLALAFESKGRGRSISGFFETDQNYGNGKQGTISLGPNVDDEVKLSFDFRVWMSAPNFNTGDTNNHVPNFGQLRFGLFQDTDNELGQTNNFAGQSFTSAVWGEEDGTFRGELAGPDGSGDAGWYVRLPLMDPSYPLSPDYDELFDPGLDGVDARINEETNLGSNARWLQDGDNQTVALPDQDTPDFVNLETQKRYHIEFSLRRFDEATGSTDPNDPGDNIEATITVTDIDDPLASTWSFSGFDPFDDTNGPGFESDSWDYFTAQIAGSSDSNDFDFIMDNFMIEIFGSNAPENDADFDNDGDVDGADFLAIQRNDPSLIPAWEAAFGTGGSPISAVPEPGGLTGLGLASLLAWGTRRRRKR